VRTHRVLVFGDDTRAFLAVVRSLGRHGVEVHAAPFNPDAPALRSRHVAQVHILPRYDGSDTWIAALIDLTRRIPFDLLVPCDDRSLLCLDAYRHRLAPLRLAIPGRYAIDVLFDKHHTRQLAQKLGVHTARGRLLRAADTPEALLAEFRLPLFLKARRSYSLGTLDTRGKVTVIRSPERLEAALDQITMRENYLVEAGINGVGKGVSLIASGGEVLCAFQHLRLREPRDGGGSSLRQSEALDPVLLESCAAIMRHTGYSGVAMFEFRVDPDSRQWVLLEVNARFWGSLPLPVMLGVDFPAYLFDLYVLNRKCGQVDYPLGVRSRNLAIYAYDVLIRDARPGLRPLLGLVKDGLGVLAVPFRLIAGLERSDTFQADDWKPAVLELAHLPPLALRALRHRLADAGDASHSSLTRGHKA
jgi:predicted ATP-grasp superfamily ATP-dependent carboligase